MYLSILTGIFRWLINILWWVAPFTFVFSLIYAIKNAIAGGEKTVLLGFAAAVSLFVMVAGCALH